ncbi:hypothetical protein FQN52_007699 [Onygenales sp. PD_12]|nr:hypothetical protein FQN52_007699 [Onygenales sp. PD_12]
MASLTSQTTGTGIPAPATPPVESQLSEQLRQGKLGTENKGSSLAPPAANTPENRSPVKGRSLSDGSRTSASASPNPLGLQRTKDDIAVTAAPATPQRPERLAHGLSLQMPPKMFGSPIPTGNRAPLSPKLDSSQIYGSPASVLPRRSRGLDFSRACTNLHHSTLAESSPDSSPVVIGRGVAIPNRRGTTHSTSMGSPNTYGNTWQSSGLADRAVISSSVSSVNMFDSDTTSSSDEEDESMHTIDREDPILTTPQVARPANAFSTPFSTNTAQSPGGDWMGGFSAAKASLMSFQRARLRRSRHNSTSTSGNSSKPSPGPISPPVMKSIENSAGGYFSKEMSMSEVKSRRESLSLGTSDLHLSDISDDETRQGRVSSPSSGSLPNSSNIESGRHGVIRRPVTRRGNLLPKTKNFARIRAALFEEGAPIDFEAKREAEVIRQVRESDADLPPLSPTLISPIAAGPEAAPVETAPTGAAKDTTSLPPVQTPNNFSRQANQNSGGIEFWNSFDNRYRTPPPPATQSITDDAMMQTPPSGFNPLGDPHSQTSTPQVGPSRVAAEASRKNNKRRRDEMMDVNAFKRRAVSPGMSLQNSPVASQSNSFKESGRIGQQSKATSTPTTRGEPGSTNGHPKRIGLQGMNETNDGLMNMSID